MKIWFVCLLWVFSMPAMAEPAGVLKLTSEKSVDEVYTSVYQALENEKFWVVFEADMGKRMAKFADKWGEDYNRNDLESVQSIVFCNIWWTNQIANADPDLLAYCPLHLSLYGKDGKTVILMPRLSVLAEGSPGQESAVELEAALRKIVEGALVAE